MALEVFYLTPGLIHSPALAVIDFYDPLPSCISQGPIKKEKS